MSFCTDFIVLYFNWRKDEYIHRRDRAGKGNENKCKEIEGKERDGWGRVGTEGKEGVGIAEGEGKGKISGREREYVWGKVERKGNVDRNTGDEEGVGDGQWEREWDGNGLGTSF